MVNSLYLITGFKIKSRPHKSRSKQTQIRQHQESCDIILIHNYKD